MKNIFKLLAVTALAGIAAASCTKELNGTAEGNEATVNFSVTSPLIGTKAVIADGNTVDKVACYIYDEAGKHIAALDKVENMNGGKATFSATLVTGKTYQFLFWAYKDGVKGYTVDADKKTLTVDYTDALANDATRAAFSNYVASYKVTGDKTEEVKLKRPFAQINFGVTAAEWEDFEKAGGAVTKTGIKVSGAAKVLNFADASVAGSADVVFAANTIPAESEKLSISGADYRYLATTYVLAGKDKSSIHNITLTKDGLQDADIVVPNAPLQANWRTNIYGSLLTSTQNFNIVVEPGFESDNNVGMISTTSALQAIFKNGGSATLTSDIDIDKALDLAAGKSVVLNLNGKKITNKGTDAAIRVSGDLEINGEGSVYGGTGGDNVAVWAAQGGKVTINGGEYSVGKDANGLANSCVYAYGGDIVINGGTFSSEQPWNGKYYVLNKNNGTPQSTITVTGGTFINYDPSTGDDNLGGNFVASGYQSTKVSDNPATYVVTKEGVTPVTSQEGLETVLSSSQKGAKVTLKIADGDYTLYNKNVAADKDLSITFIGNGIDKTSYKVGTDQQGSEYGTDYSLKGASATFKNMKIVSTNGDYKGFAHAKELHFEDCTLVGQFAYTGAKATFKNCTFVQESKDHYNLQTYTADEYIFDNCVFKAASKFLYTYREKTTVSYKVTFNGCKFEVIGNDETEKSAVSLKTDAYPSAGGAKYYIYFNSTKADDKVHTGDLTGSKLYSSDLGYNAEEQKKTYEKQAVVYIDNKLVWENGATVQ